jgi:Ca2+-transporting ATPase
MIFLFSYLFFFLSRKLIQEDRIDGGVLFTVAGTGEVITSKDRHLYEILTAITLCNNAQIESGSLVGQPTEGGLLSVAHKAGIPDLRKTTKRLREIPFDSLTKWMAV